MGIGRIRHILSTDESLPASSIFTGSRQTFGLGETRLFAEVLCQYFCLMVSGALAVFVMVEATTCSSRRKLHAPFLAEVMKSETNSCANYLAGPGIAAMVKTGEEVGFVVDAKSAGKGRVTCTVLTPDGSEAEAEVIENEDGTYDIYYTAAKPGTYVIYVRFGGVDIPNSPFTVMVRGLGA